ncbi:Putative protein of unknown function [Podospora comata]|uniref:Uncharacterized protein n=1 Tax=Podospora comata TaxID=48703 RepID=A0ABY6RUT4_PODCO|nr:Putative protein of unknown function [Podospora comata]
MSERTAETPLSEVGSRSWSPQDGPAGVESMGRHQQPTRSRERSPTHRGFRDDRAPHHSQSPYDLSCRKSLLMVIGMEQAEVMPSVEGREDSTFEQLEKNDMLLQARNKQDMVLFGAHDMRNVSDMDREKRRRENWEEDINDLPY